MPWLSLSPASGSLRLGCLRPMRLLPRVVAMPWLSLSPASGSLRLSWDLSNLRPLRPTRASRRLSAVSRSSNSNKMRTTRTKTACLSWLTSFNLRSRPTRSRLRRLRRLLLLTWPSSARLNKSLRRLRTGPSSPSLSSQLLAQCSKSESKHLIQHGTISLTKSLTEEVQTLTPFYCSDDIKKPYSGIHLCFLSDMLKFRTEEFHCI